MAERIAIIDNGVIVRKGRPTELKAEVGSPTLFVSVDASVDRPGDHAVRPLRRPATQCRRAPSASGSPTGRAPCPSVVRTLDEAGITVKNLELREPSLDDVFAEATGYRSKAPTRERARHTRRVDHTDVAAPEPVERGTDLGAVEALGPRPLASAVAGGAVDDLPAVLRRARHVVVRTGDHPARLSGRRLVPRLRTGRRCRAGRALRLDRRRDALADRHRERVLRPAAQSHRRRVRASSSVAWLAAWCSAGSRPCSSSSSCCRSACRSRVESPACSRWPSAARSSRSRSER